VLTGWHPLPKPSFINQRFGLLIMLKPSFINQDLEDEQQPQLQVQQLCQNEPTTTYSNQSNNISTPKICGP
jgi:hypothetical protein